MSQIVIQAQKRGTGKSATKAARKNGLVPGVFYAKGREAVAVATTAKALRPIVYTSRTHVVQLEIEGSGAERCILKDITFDPVTDEIVHFDLLGLIDNHPVQVKVPVKLKGQSKGVLSGAGIMEQLTQRVNIECLPNAIPEAIELDVTELEVGKSLHVRDINVDGVKVLARPETMIVSIQRRKVRGGDAAAAEGKK
jgi:large subunit ribosomal protein L25